MLTKQQSKRERMHLRLNTVAKRKLERAASYAHKSVSEFVLLRALEAADEVIEAQEQNVLSAADWQAFYRALDKPPRPNKALKEGFRWYRQRRA